MSIIHMMYHTHIRQKSMKCKNLRIAGQRDKGISVFRPTNHNSLHETFHGIQNRDVIGMIWGKARPLICSVGNYRLRPNYPILRNIDTSSLQIAGIWPLLVNKLIGMSLKRGASKQVGRISHDDTRGTSSFMSCMITFSHCRTFCKKYQLLFSM